MAVTSPIRRRGLPCAVLGVGALAAAAAPARADVPGSARGVARAGASVVSDDGAAAVVVNPAALARRDAVRGQVGVVVADDAARFDPDGDGDGVVVEDRGPAAVSPLLGGQGRVGPLVVGAALVDDARVERRFAAPEPGQPAADVARLFPHRYAGIAMATRRRTLAVGASWRATEWLAVGASVTASQVELEEVRRVWAGFAGREEVGDPARDVTVRVAGEDGVVPGGVLGVLVAPIDVPIELAASVAWGDAAHLDGDASATAGTDGVAVVASGGRAAARLPAPVVVRTGARWLGERWVAEVGGTLAIATGDDPAWIVRGLSVIDAVSTAMAPIDGLASGAVTRTAGAVRGAVDVAVVPGLAWVTAGWAWASAATPRERLDPAAGDLGGHTGALGVEVATDGVTVTLGVARAFTGDVEVGVTHREIANPFAAGTAPAGLGRHARTRDTVALTVELELP